MRIKRIISSLPKEKCLHATDHHERSYVMEAENQKLNLRGRLIEAGNSDLMPEGRYARVGDAK
jgi:hypothetical protein